MKRLILCTLAGCALGAWPIFAAVTNITQGGAVHATIQGAVNAAVNGDTLLIGVGHYGELVTINQKSLILKGGYLPNFVTRTNVPSLTCINGGGGGVALAVLTNCTVVLEYVMITNGASVTGGGIRVDAGATLTAQYCIVAQNTAWVGGGAAVGTASTLVLSDTSVSNNLALGGGGLHVASNGVAIINGTTRVQRNWAAVLGGGAYVEGTLIGASWSASIEYNMATDGGGVAVNAGLLDLSPGHVSYNQATNITGRGGGVYVYNGGRAMVTGSGNVYRNRAYNGGGIYADKAQVELRAVLHGNSASNFGGGICLVNGSALSATTTVIGDTLAARTNYARYGGGIYALTSSVVFSGTIYNNHAGISGGGMYTEASTVMVYNARVGGVAAYQANLLGPNGNVGAGLYLSGTDAIISNTVIASNVFQTTGFTYGGGMYIAGGSSVRLIDSRIEHHLAPSAVDGRGAGMYVSASAVTLDNSQIISNTAGTTGGGARLWTNGRFSLQNGSVVAHNHALGGPGGGIACGALFAIAIEDATLSDNSAATDGGAIYLSAGTQAFTGGWTLRDNTAGGHGGAIAVTGSGHTTFRATAPCVAYGNRALGGHGGMLYLNVKATVQLYATSGSPMDIHANQASGNGGALYADNEGYFDVYGQVALEDNRASNGGAIYLSNGSRVWLDDYVNILPQVCGNVAETGSGGGIYADNSPSVRLTVPAMGREGTGNYAAVRGGAMAVFSSTVRVERATAFVDNSAGTGGALASSNSVITLEAGQQKAPLFIRNTSFGAAANDGGGAIYAEHGTRLVYPNALFADNTSSNNGGALWLRNATAELAGNFAEWPGGATPPTFFSNNVAVAGSGGAVYLSAGSSAALADALIVGNQASLGGGIRISTSTADLVNVVLYRNSAGVRIASGRVRARHCTVVSNTNDGITGGGAISVSNCIVRGHTVNIADGKDAQYSNIEGGYATGTGNIDAEPLFVDVAAYNLALRHNSPCVDAGVNAGITWDCIGAPRPMKAGFDMGAYEMNPAPVEVIVPTLLDFGDVAVGDSASLTIHVQNKGNSAVTGAVAFVPAPIFTILPNSYVVPPLDVMDLTATFAPPLEFVWTSTVIFTSNAGTQDVVLIGTGVPEPGIVLLGIMLLAYTGTRGRGRRQA